MESVQITSVDFDGVGSRPCSGGDILPACNEGTEASIVATASPHAEIALEIRELWRMRQRWHKAEKILILQAKAICRMYCEGDKDKANKMYEDVVNESENYDAVNMALMPFLPAIKNFAKERKAIEKRLEKLAQSLPVWKEFGEGIKGFGKLSLAAIVGETTCFNEDGKIRTFGDYFSVQGLWKRMGLAVIDGERQRKKADAELALIHGYSPGRRSVMWNIGGLVIGGMGLGPRLRVGAGLEEYPDLTPYQKVFVERCRYLAQRDIDVLAENAEHECQYRRDPVKHAKTGEMRESFSKHCAASAKRYVEKRLIRDMYNAWRGCEGIGTPK